MRNVPEAEPLIALKTLLRDLENTKLIYPDDISILSLKRDLTAKIASLKKQQPIIENCEAHEMAAE